MASITTPSSSVPPERRSSLLLRLPTEILHNILDEVQALKSLSTVALVCRLLHRLAIHRLYREVSFIHRSYTTQETLLDILLDSPNSSEMRSACRRLAVSFVGHTPLLLRLDRLKSLVAMLPNVDSVAIWLGWVTRNLWPFLSVCLNTMPKIEHLYLMSDGGNPEVEPGVSNAIPGSTVKDIIVDNVGNMAPWFHARNLPYLTSLELRNYAGQPDDLVSLLRGPFRLEHFKLFISTPRTPNAPAWSTMTLQCALSPHAESLRMLYLHYNQVQPSLELLDFSAFQELTLLDLSPSFFDTSKGVPPKLQSLVFELGYNIAGEYRICWTQFMQQLRAWLHEFAKHVVAEGIPVREIILDHTLPHVYHDTIHPFAPTGCQCGLKDYPWETMDAIIDEIERTAGICIICSGDGHRKVEGSNSSRVLTHEQFWSRLAKLRKQQKLML